MRRVLGAGALGLWLLLGAAGVASAVSIRGITTSAFAGFSRVTVDLSEKAKPAVVYFPAEPENGKPERIALDFPGAELDVGGPTRIEVKDGRIDAIRFGRTREGGVRVVIDLVRPARHRALRHISPPRIELDVLGEAAP
jgi:hypothetical protein